MNSNENLSVKGKLNIVITDAQGNLKEERLVDNLVVSSGIQYILARAGTSPPTAMTHMGVGTGSTAAAAGNTTLGTPQGARIALTSTTANATTIVYASTFGPGVSTGALTEAGIFSDVSAGTMLCRTVFLVVNKGAGDSMTITWTVTLTAV